MRVSLEPSSKPIALLFSKNAFDTHLLTLYSTIRLVIIPIRPAIITTNAANLLKISAFNRFKVGVMNLNK